MCAGPPETHWAPKQLKHNQARKRKQDANNTYTKGLRVPSEPLALENSWHSKRSNVSVLGATGTQKLEDWQSQAADLGVVTGIREQLTSELLELRRPVSSEPLSSELLAFESS